MNRASLGYIYAAACISIGITGVWNLASATRSQARGTMSLLRREPASSAVPEPAIAAPQSHHRGGGALAGDLFFGAPTPTPPQPAAPPSRSLTVAPVSMPAAAPDRLAGYEYAGSAAMDGVTYALLEDRKTRSGTYVTAGEEFRGMRVEQVSDDEVALTANGSVRRLARSDSFSTTPLLADAAGMDRTGGAQVVVADAHMGSAALGYTEEVGGMMEIARAEYDRAILASSSYYPMTINTLRLDKAAATDQLGLKGNLVLTLTDP